MFERFTDEARRALTIAQEEAKGLDHDFIGTEHLLLGLLAADGGVAAEALADLGVTLDEARAKVEERVHPARSATQGNPPFTPLAKKALERSLRAALELNDSYIGPEHMVLGLIDVPDGGGARVLADLSGSLEHSRATVLTHIARSPTHLPKRESGSRRSRLWITRGTTGAVGGGGTSTPIAELAAHPLCPSCKSSLVDHARHRVLLVPMSDESDPAGPSGAPAPADAMAVGLGTGSAAVPITATVVYCGHCGTAVGLA